VQLVYGTYSFDTNSTDVRMSSSLVENKMGYPLARRTRLTVDGWLSVSSQSDCTQKMNALKTALNTPYLDLILKQDDAANSAILLQNSGSITGVKIVSGPSFPASNAEGGIYTTLQRFTFEAEAEYPLAGTANLLLSFTETLTFSGGGPRYTTLPALKGPPQRQLIYEQTPYIAVQSGSAVGYRSYPTKPQPIWPFALKVNPNVVVSSPDRVGKTGYQDYAISWRYDYEYPTVLVGKPNVWLG